MNLSIYLYSISSIFNSIILILFYHKLSNHFIKCTYNPTL